MLVQNKLSDETAIKEFSSSPNELPNTRIVQGKRIFLQNNKPSIQTQAYLPCSVNNIPHSCQIQEAEKQGKQQNNKDICEYLDEYDKAIQQDNKQIKGYFSIKRPLLVKPSQKFYEVQKDYLRLAGSTKYFGLKIDSNMKKQSLKNTVQVMKKLKLSKL